MFKLLPDDDGPAHLTNAQLGERVIVSPAELPRHWFSIFQWDDSIFLHRRVVEYPQGFLAALGHAIWEGEITPYEASACLDMPETLLRIMLAEDRPIVSARLCIVTELTPEL